MVNVNTTRKHKGLTLLEMVIAMAIMVVIIAAMLPQITAVNNSWESRRQRSEALQNGRVLVEHMNRNLAKAARIVDASEPATVNGFLEFEATDNKVYRYEVSASNMVQFGLVGSLSDMAGPVNNFKFTCYDDNDLDTQLVIATDGVDDIRFVKAAITMTNSAALGQDKNLIASVYLRTGTSSTTGLIGHWKLDENSGKTAFDSSGSDNHGTLKNMVGNEWVTGVFDGALEFSASDNNDYVVVSEHSSINDMETFTLLAWVYVNNHTDYGRFVQKWPHFIFSLGNDSDRNMVLTAKSWGGQTKANRGFWRTDNGTIQTGQWYHVAVTYDYSSTANDPVFYIDGASVNVNETETPVGSRSPDSADILIGNHDNLYQFLDGMLDDIRMYNRILTPEEIAGFVADFSIDPGTPVMFESVRTVKDPVLSKIDSTHFLCAYDTTVDGWGTVLTVDTDNMTVSAETDYTITATGGKTPTLNQIDSKHYLYAHSDQAPDNDGWARVLQVDTNTWAITAATSLEYDTSRGLEQQIEQIDSTHYLCTYSGPSDEALAVVLTVDTSDWSITAGTPMVIATSAWETELEKIDDTHFICGYKSSPGLSMGYVRILEVDTSSWTVSMPGSSFRYHTKTIGLLLEKIDDENVLGLFEAIGECGWSSVFNINTSTWEISMRPDRDQLRNGRRGFSLKKVLGNNFLHVSGSTSTGIGEGSIIEVDSAYGLSEIDIPVEFGSDVDAVAIEQIDTNNYLCVYTDSAGNGWAIIISVNAVAEINSSILP